MSFYTIIFSRLNYFIIVFLTILYSMNNPIYSKDEPTKKEVNPSNKAKEKNIKQEDVVPVATTAVNTPSAKAINPASALDTSEKLIYMVFSDGPTVIEKGFKEYLSERGIKVKYIERDCKGDIKKCNRFVEEIRQLKPDLIYTWGTPAPLAIAGKIDEPNKEKYIWDIPIVAAIIGNPIFSKIIYDLKKPGRNLTGVNHIAPYEAQVNAMLSYFPTKKIAIFFTPKEVIAPIQVSAISKACKEKGISPVEFPFDHIINGKLDESKLDDAFAEIKAAGIDLVYLPSSNMLNLQGTAICNSAKKNKLLTFIVSDGMLAKEAEPLMGLIAHRINVGRFAAVKAEQILVGKMTPQDIPHETFEKFSFFIMKNIMLGLGVYPPLMTINRASFIEVHKKNEEETDPKDTNKDNKATSDKDKK